MDIEKVGDGVPRSAFIEDDSPWSETDQQEEKLTDL